MLLLVLHLFLQVSLGPLMLPIPINAFLICVIAMTAVGKFIQLIAPLLSKFHKSDLSDIIPNDPNKLWSTIEKFSKLAQEADFSHDENKFNRVEALKINEFVTDALKLE